MAPHPQYHIGETGQPWTGLHKKAWLAEQKIQRSYQKQVLDKLSVLKECFIVEQYGALPWDQQRYPLFFIKSQNWEAGKASVLITGGVHGYETSGVQGALRFAQNHASDYLQSFNLIIVPCVSPWGYESVNRWNPDAVDPNRSFSNPAPAPEAQLLMDYIESLKIDFVAHFDLHETTDTDNSEFRPARAARDGTINTNWNIPDGFYTVGDTQRVNADFQRAVIESVAKVTHIAPADENGELIGKPLEQHGVINYPQRELALCGGFTDAKYVTTTEVYPDSPKASPENCIQAQIAALRGGLDYIIAEQNA